ncbi:MAG: hypothetical protein HDR92_03920 [Bacteroides sp.]|nr:hypothetical protein [Bacteroides sp.]
MRRITTNLMSLFAIIAAALFASCSSQSRNKILEAVPSDATGVTFIDFERLRNAGVELTELSLSRYMIPSAEGIGAEVALSDGVMIGIMPAPAPDSLSAAGFKVSGEPDGTLTPYTNPDGLTSVVDSRNGIAYSVTMSAPRAMELIKEVVQAASNKSFASNLGLADQFVKDAEAGAVIYGALSRSLIGNYKVQPGDTQSSQWLTYSIRQESDVASVSAKLMEGSGKPVELKGLQAISTDFLRYVPADMNVVAAAGLTPEIDWDAAAALVNMVADRTTAGYIAAAAPYLKSIDGTVAIALGFDKAGNLSPATTRFLAMVRMDRSKINEVVRQAGVLAALGGASTEQISATVSRIALPASSGMPSEIYIGEVDGNLVISSYLPDGKANNSFTTSVEGHEAAAVVAVPARVLPAAQFPANQGIDVRFILDSTGATTRVAFPGADRTPLAVLAGILGI